MKDLTAKELLAIKKAIENCNYAVESAERFYDDGTVSINKGRNGKTYAWFMTESAESAVDVDTFEELTEEEIERILI